MAARAEAASPSVGQLHLGGCALRDGHLHLAAPALGLPGHADPPVRRLMPSVCGCEPAARPRSDPETAVARLDDLQSGHVAVKERHHRALAVVVVLGTLHAGETVKVTIKQNGRMQTIEMGL